MIQFNAVSRLEAMLSRAACCTDQTERSAEFWRLLVEDSWYQEQLGKSARRALRRANRPSEWIGDVKQQAMLLLARQLSHSLHRAAFKSKITSPGWLLVAIRGHCREAVQSKCAGARHCRQFLDEEDFAEPYDDRAAIIDLREAIECLEEPQRTILRQQAKGASLKKIAHDQGLDYWQAWRLSRQGIEQLRARLVPPLGDRW